MENKYGIMLIPAIILLVICALLLVCAVGAFVGWLISLTFLGTWIVACFASFGFVDVNLMYLGTTLAFIGMFFVLKSGD